MNLNLKEIINDLLLQESVREVDTFINQQRDEINRINFTDFFDKFKNFSSLNPNQLGPITVPFFKWLFSVSFQQNPNITDQELNNFFEISILYFNNKNKINFDFKQNPPNWNTFKLEVLKQTQKQREKRAEESTLIQLISKDINTKWVEDLGNSKINRQKFIKRFKAWESGSLFDESSEDSELKKENNILVIEPRTTLSSKFWGNPRCFGVDIGYGVKWCTSATQAGNMFHDYTKQSGSRLIYIIDLTQPDQNPWQKIAVLIKAKITSYDKQEINIFDATDKKYSIKEVQSHIKPEIFQIINELINRYSNTSSNKPTEQYSPSQFENLSQEEKRILFLTSLRDPSSEDKNYIQKHFREVFDDPMNSENDRRQIINNLIGSSDYDNTLIDLISDYLHLPISDSYEEIIKYLNTPEKRSKAAAKFYDNRTYFSQDKSEEETEHWDYFNRYLTREQKRKIAEKFILKNEEYFPANWNELSKYLTSEEKINMAEKYILNQNHFNFDTWNQLSKYLKSTEKKKVAEKFLIKNQSDLDFDEIWYALSNYLTKEEKNKAAWKKILNSDYYESHFLFKYLNGEQKERYKLLKNRW